MPSFTEMGQMALSHLGSGKTITDIETEQSEEARALRTFQETALKKVMAAAPWPFCTEIVDLNLVEEDPNDDWDYSYVYPPQAIKIRKLLSGLTTDYRDSRVPFRLANSSTGKLIWTDQDDAQAEITVYEDDPTLYSPEFVMAFTYYWAHLAAPRICKGNPGQVKEQMFKYFKQEMSEAMASAFNEEQPQSEPDCEFLRSRE